MPSFTTTLEHSIHAALALANSKSHEFATLEHLLLTLIDEPDAQRVLKACDVDLEILREALGDFIDEELSSMEKEDEKLEATPTAAFQRVIQRAAIHVQSSGRSEVTGANVLVAIFAERESNAAYFLQEQEMTRYDAVNFIAHGVAKNPAFGEQRSVQGSDENGDDFATSGAEPEAEKKESALSKYCVDLNAKAISLNTKENNVIEIQPESKELGFVGIPNKINIEFIKEKINEKIIPIISPLGLGLDKKTYNINGDTAAGAIAKSLKSRRLLLMTNVEGVLNKNNNLIEEISSSKILGMIEDKTITEGMIPKINTCLDAVHNGVTAVAIIDGRKKHSVLFEIFSDKGSGTLIRK